MNTGCSAGIYTVLKTIAAEESAAKINFTLFKILMVNRLRISLLHSKTCTSCVKTSVTNAAVRACSTLCVIPSTAENAASTESPSNTPRMMIVAASPPENTESPRPRGRSFITSSWGGSKLSAMAGMPSVTRFTIRICMGSSTTGIPISMPKNMVTTSPMLQDSR